MKTPEGRWKLCSAGFAIPQAATEPHRHHEFLGTVGPACRRLHVRDLLEVFLQHRLHFVLGTARQHLGDKGAAVFQHVEGKGKRRLDQRHDPQVVGSLVAA
jgi:hypothetical protein